MGVPYLAGQEALSFIMDLIVAFFHHLCLLLLLGATVDGGKGQQDDVL
ncbi:hypothetical protein OESDEN_02322 [Oesophagostomum dentatum]|uniref:Uncharacterized protein n=1 Tax=Oesophagostomum dentatum TaxID=61180 RepID=A0A0B1TJJ7_OESDE|nr:hypothetical protein OESDEN_02322 [Oesophagostomum dentatum]